MNENKNNKKIYIYWMELEERKKKGELGWWGTIK